MTTLTMFTPDGGFLCGDTETRKTAYAYASSYYATKAAKAPLAIAAEMLAAEMDREGLPPSLRREVIQRDRDRLALLEKSAT
jgi:hypothetical protein